METVAGDEISIAKLGVLQASSALDGYFWPLRNLVKFNPDYAQAIAAIGRDWLNAVIVRDVPALLKVGEAAKRLKISRLTTVPLSEIGDIPVGLKPNIPGARFYLTDVITCDQPLRNLVNFVFGDSVIVDSAKGAFLLARRGFRAVTMAGDVFEPDVLAFETGYAKKYSQIAELLGQQGGYDGVKNILTTLHGLIGRRKGAILDLHARARSFELDEREHDMQISRIETKLETTKQFVSKYAQDTKTLSERLASTKDEIERLETERKQMETRLNGIALGSQKLASMLSAFDFSAFDEHSAEINRMRMNLDSELEQAIAEIREIEIDITRAKGDLENNQRPSLERLQQQCLESETKYSDKSKFLIESEPRLSDLESNLSALKEREA